MILIKNLLIETAHLIIRPYRPSDLEPSFQLMQNKELFTYLHMDVMSLEEYQGLFNWLISSYDTDIEADFKYSFAIILKESDKLIGWCGVGGLEFHQMELPRLVAKVDARNMASKKIIEKLGFQFDHVISGLPEEFSDCNGELYYSLDNPNSGF
jgi:ribosomal-protein-alanine N-acetyltransferase